MNVLYVVYIPDGTLARYIDAIRAIANPGEKHRAHITLRGPYSQPRDVEGPDSIISGAQITVSTAGNFFQEGQSTVFFSCEAPELKRVWDKRDFGFNPHLTLYDGPSKTFAKALWEVVNNYSYSFSFMAGGLTPVVARSRQTGLSLLADFDSSLITSVTGEDVEASSLLYMTADKRLNLIDRLCNRLSRLKGNDSANHNVRVVEPPNGAKMIIVSPSSVLLSNIRILARQNSATLGFLPDGAFDSYASKRNILAAISEQDELMGYLIYRVTRMRATLVHLCVASEYRQQGVSRFLFGELITQTRSLSGILVSSRRDFDTHTMWPRFGFAAIGEMPGRGHRRTTLTRWWYEHPHDNLFSYESLDGSKNLAIDVAIDLNIFYDFYSPYHNDQESGALQADWLADEIVFCVTPEVFNEIDRLSEPSDRAVQKRIAHEYKRVSGSAHDFRHAYSALLTIFKKPQTAQNESDLHHLAHVAASGTQYFLTRDKTILKRQDQIEKTLRITALKPTDLIIDLDEIRDTISYQPVRLSGSRLKISRISRSQARKIPTAFVATDQGETKSSLNKLLDRFLGMPNTVVPQIICRDEVPVAIYLCDISSNQIMGVPLLRVNGGNLASTLARQVVDMTIDAAIKKKFPIIRIKDPFLSPIVEDALNESGFVLCDSEWTKANLSIVDDAKIVADNLENLASEAGNDNVWRRYGEELPPLLRGEMTAENLFRVERCLKPVKILGGKIGTFIIPIKPQWAQQLFDSELAEQTLFGSSEELILNWENVYYRAPRKLPGLQAPFRVLWYVVRDRRYAQTAKIRAYSVGGSIEILEAQEAFRRFRRLGVYDKKQVLDIAKGKPNGKVMAIRFSDTEQFRNPISLIDVRHHLAEIDGLHPVFQSPYPISEEAFSKFYRLGTGCLNTEI